MNERVKEMLPKGYDALLFELPKNEIGLKRYIGKRGEALQRQGQVVVSVAGAKGKKAKAKFRRGYAFATLQKAGVR